MADRRTDPMSAMCRALTDGARLSSFAGGPFDVRAVVAAVRPAAKDGFLLGEVPWGYFPQGDRVREAVHLLHTGNSPVRTGTGVVSGMCADHTRAAAVLAVPFLIRIAADPAPNGLRTAVDDLATDERAHAMDGLPWMAAAGGSGETGLRRCVRRMLHPGQPDPADCDDPWCPHH
ncbi:hypothetical protein ABT224_14385 [Streptomyces sp. NPDC001584]|uniref:hypothetical protein n=1 Tax=Streptomyces sp. NPDC001584 TaxID=3154521 RepID=UPI003323A72A